MMRLTPFLLHTLAGGVVAGLIGAGTSLLLIDMAVGFRPVEGGLSNIPEVRKILYLVFWLGTVSTIVGILGLRWWEWKEERKRHR